MQELRAQYGLICVAILTLSDLIATFEAPGTDPKLVPSPAQLDALRAYRHRYGVTDVA